MLSSSRSSIQTMLYLILTGLSHSTFALLGSDLRLPIYVALGFPPEQASGITFCDHGSSLHYEVDPTIESMLAAHEWKSKIESRPLQSNASTNQCCVAEYLLNHSGTFITSPRSSAAPNVHTPSLAAPNSFSGFILGRRIFWLQPPLHPGKWKCGTIQNPSHSPLKATFDRCDQS